MGKAFFWQRHTIPRPGRKMDRVQVIVLRLEDFPLFKSLYGDQFSLSIEKGFEESVRRGLDENRFGVKDGGICQIALEPGEQALIWYDSRQREDVLDLAFSLRLAVQSELQDFIYQRTGQSIRIRVGQAERKMADYPGFEKCLFACLSEARHMSQNGFTMQHMVLNREFQDILTHSRLSVLYQPIVEFYSGQVFGWEALSRGPEGSVFHSPLFLFNFAEESGNLFQLERACREKAIRQCRELSSGQKLFLNIHPQTLSDPDFTPGETKRILEGIGLAADNVVFEITERHAIKDFKLFHQTLEHYRRQGFLIAMDDVGSGYSGLISIARIRPHFIKIDKSLVFEVDRDPVKKALLETFVTFADKIGAKIIAEGIENHSTLQTLGDLGVHLGQGYYIARPDYPPPEVNLRSLLTSGLPLSEGSRCNLPVRQFVNTTYTVNERTTVDEVRRKFEDLGPLASIVIQRHGEPVGLIMSHQLDRQLSTRYGVALYYSRQVTALMDPDPLVVDESLSIEAVAQKATEREESKTYDDIIVTRCGKLLGVVSVQQLIESMASFQVEMAKGSNPLTGLPGNVALEAEIEKRIDLGGPFNIVYGDLDNFKAYNDAYGFQCGDQMILLLARIMKRCQHRYGQSSDFIGHVGGDDFVIVTSNNPERFCLGAVRCFERASRSCYTVEDREQGRIFGSGRDGVAKEFPLVTVSLGILQVEGPTSLKQISERAADVKKYAKSISGNSFVADRRSPLGTKQPPHPSKEAPSGPSAGSSS